jgi:hypothetical protein
MTKRSKVSSLAVAIAAAYMLAAPAHAQGTDVQAELEGLKLRLSQQSEMLENLRRAVADQEVRYRELQRAFEAQRAQLERAQVQLAQPPRPPQPAAEAPRTVQIGTAPAEVPPNVPQIFEQPGVLTPAGQLILEPSLQYGYSSSNRAALVGYTVIPAVLIGLIDVREVRRNTVTAALTVRRGITDRFEIEGRVPYVYRSDSTVSRELFTGTSTETAFSANGSGIGDVEVTGRYQFTDGSDRMPFLIGSLRFKSRTGKDPFEVTTDCTTRCVGNATGTGQPLDLPTGSGFYTLQPGLTWLYPSDPAVFFGSFTYAHNFKRTDVSREILGGQREFIGTVEPGNVFGVNFGMGLALNDRSSFSMGVDLSSIGRTKINGSTAAGSVRTQLATLLLGYSHRFQDNRLVNLSVGAGLTRDTPDLTLTLRMPFSL